MYRIVMPRAVVLFINARAVFTAISPIKSVVDVNVKSAALSRCANSGGEISFRVYFFTVGEGGKARVREVSVLRCANARNRIYGYVIR